MDIVKLAIRNARLTLSVLVFLVIAGALAYRAVPKEAEPDVAIPIMYVSLVYQGISPEDSERLLLRPVESQLKNLKGLKEMKSAAYEGGGYVLVEFDPSTDLSDALIDTRNKVQDAKRDLPAGVEEPTVNEVNISEFPVLVVTLSGNLPEVARKALAEGAAGLTDYRVALFRPVGPMLASMAEDLDATLRDFQGGAALEDKLDGARVQVHKSGDDVRIFSRQLNDVTASLPELVELIKRLPLRSVILDGETLAIRPDGRPHPFQVTMRRFGRSQHDHEQRDDLAVEAERRVPREGDEVDVGPVQHEFDAHQHADAVPLGGHAHHAGHKQHRREEQRRRQKVLFHVTPPLSARRGAWRGPDRPPRPARRASAPKRFQRAADSPC